MSRWRLGWGLATTVLLSVVPRAASAQDGTEIATARQLGQEGALAAQAGHCDEAIEKLTKASKLLPAPTILVPLGECQIAVGRVVAGTETLQRVAREELPPNAKEPFVVAQKRARKALPLALEKLAKLKLVVKGAPEESLVVTDNGEPVSAALVGIEHPADPKKHLIVVTAPGYVAATAEVTLKSGQTEVLEIVLVPDPKQKATAPSPPPLVRRGPPGRKANSGLGRPLVWVGGVLSGVGAAALIAGGATGAVAIGKKSDLDEVCRDKLCPDSSQSDIDSLSTFSKVSTAMFVVGAVTGAVGVTFVVLGVATDHDQARGARAAVWIGPRALGLEGSF